MRLVRSFVKEDDELVELDGRIDGHRAMSWENTRAAAALGALATLISGLGTVFLIASGIVLVDRGRLTVGELPAKYRSVSFAYVPDGATVLRDIDLPIEPGMRLGVLGPSGAGKSTLLALVPRLYDVPQGLDPSGCPGAPSASTTTTYATSAWSTSAGRWRWSRAKFCCSRARSAQTCSTPIRW
jgi:ABC-type multidrug transport system fused ATPase/permease subunit